MIAELLFVGLAAWRVALFLTDDAGPFGLASHLRVLLRVEQGAGPPIDTAGGWFKLWTCMRCMTAWTALAFFLLWHLAPAAVDPFAIWGLAGLVDELIARHDQGL